MSGILKRYRFVIELYWSAAGEGDTNKEETKKFDSTVVPLVEIFGGYVNIGPCLEK